MWTAWAPQLWVECSSRHKLRWQLQWWWCHDCNSISLLPQCGQTTPFLNKQKKKNYTRIEVSLHLQPSQAIATSPAAYPARCTAAHPMDGSRFSLLQSIGLVATSLNSTVCIPKHQRQFSSNSHGKYWNSRLHWEITDWCTSKRLHRQPGWGGVHPGCTRRCRRSSAHGAARNVYSPLVAHMRGRMHCAADKGCCRRVGGGIGAVTYSAPSLVVAT